MTLTDLERIALNRGPELMELSANLVFADGDPDADLMLIGEAPGADEDEQGLPFVGRAGQLLDQVLASVDIDRHGTYITNIVKFRPPGNRNPTKAELSASEGILLEQIRLVNPQVIVPLGNVPSQYLLGTTDGITKLHGKWSGFQGIRVFPMYHPAYLLRNPSRTQGSPKWQMWQAAKELKGMLDGLGPKPARAHVSSARQEGLF